ncbi:MAG: hypothetical protein RL748_4287 [Pseudomonadota bacterium]|jgi:hypothetical protein
MTRVHIICEGQTEEMFIADVLAPRLLQHGVYLIPSLIGKPGHKGGNVKFERILTDVRARLGDSSAWCSTFFDFYGLPPDFPGKVEAGKKNQIADKAACINTALQQQLTAKLGDQAMHRFIPYVQMYEFEGLLFSAPAQLALACDNSRLQLPLQAIREQFPTPEDINNNQHSAPSKRIMQLYPGYDKPLHGAIATLETGLDLIRRECRLFDQWLTQISALAP